MMWKRLAAQFAVLVPVFLLAEAQAGGDNSELNFCGNVNLKDFGNGFLSHYNYGTTRCVCRDKIPTLLARPDSHLNAAILKFGIEATHELLGALVMSAHDFCWVTYPAYSRPLCTRENPCGFRCDTGRVEVDGQCVCEPGTRECGQLCCPLEHGHLEQAAQQRFFGKTKHGDSRCEANEEICSVPGTQNGWECLNVMEAKESCGGCVYPFYVGQKTGVDCAALPGVRRAFCFMGQCQIHECNSGWEPAPDKSSCERLPGDFPESMSLGADELDELGISAEGAHAKSSWIPGVAEHSKPVRPRDSAGGHTDAKSSRPNSKGASKGTGGLSTNYKSRMARHDSADSKSHDTQREQTRASKPKQRGSMRVGQDSFPLM